VRVFLDANVLFSAAYKDSSRLRILWEMSDVHLITSVYTLDEATRNLLGIRPIQITTLSTLVSQIEIIIGKTSNLELPPHILLPQKDLVVLVDAIQNQSDVLLTGDAKHFGSLYGSRVGGITVLSPRSFLAQYT
jgi:uncharacterized protein